MSTPPPSDRSRHLRRRLRIPVAVVLILIVLWVAANIWVPRKVASAVESKLAEREMALSWKSSSWSLWRGVHLSGVVLRQTTGDQRPMVETENLYIHLPMSQWLSRNGRTTFWQIRDASVKLTDDEGTIALNDVSATLKAERGKISIRQAVARHEGLDVDISGVILTRYPSEKNTGPINFNLKAARAIIATLDFQDHSSPFKAKGTFELDLSDPDRPWKADLQGAGENLDWKGYRIDKATASAELTSESSIIHAKVSTSAGTIDGKVSRSGWKGSPFLFDGKITDTKGKTDEFNGRHENGVFTIEKLSGPADLHQIAVDILPNGQELAKAATFPRFPEIEATRIRWKKNTDPAWSIESLAWSGQGEVSVTIKDEVVTAKNLRGKTSFDGKAWKVEDAGADLLKGSISMSGVYQEGRVEKARIKASEIRIAEIGRIATDRKGAARKGVLSLDYQGSLDITEKSLDGKGSMTLDDAPVIEVPLLDQVYELFTTLIPGVKKSGSGKFSASFTAKDRMVDVTRFEATGGSLTVSAVGKVNLEKKYVSGRARGKLTGLPGMVTKPLGRLLELDVAGPYDNIRVKPLGPAKLVSNAASGTVGVAVDTVEEAGRITGTVITEGIKLPFRLFGGEEEKKDGKESKPKPSRR